MCCKGCSLSVVVALLAVVAVFIPYILEAGIRFNSHPLDDVVGNVERSSRAEMTARLAGKDVLVVGGTRGIGRGIAVSLAGFGANVGVIGRSKTGGADVIQRMKDASSAQSQRFTAHSADLSTVKGVLALTNQLKKQNLQLDYIVMTVGAWPHWEDPVSDDGMDKVIALDVLARFIVVTELHSIMRPGARVMSVLASTMKLVHPSQEDMKAIITGEQKDYALMDMMGTAGASGDVFLAQASMRYPDIKFIGTHPGLVPSDLTKNTFPAWVNTMKDLFLAASRVQITEEECGEVHAMILSSENVNKRPATYFNYLLEARGASPIKDDVEYGNWMWEYLQQFVNERKKNL